MRPASSASALSQPRSSDCRPKSPWLTVLPRWAFPLTRPRWLFRYLTRLGICGIGGLLGQIIPVIDPDLDPDVPLGGRCLGEAVLDARSQGRQRDRAVLALLAAGHFRAAQPPGELHLDAAGAVLHCLRDRLLHRAAEAGPLLQLLGDVLRDELRIRFRPHHLDRLDLDLAMGEVLQLVGELVDVLALLANDHADARRGDRDLHVLARAVDLDPADPGALLALIALREVADDKPADLHVLDEEVGEVLLARIPLALPALHDADAKPGRPDFLAHLIVLAKPLSASQLMDSLAGSYPRPARLAAHPGSP